MRIRWIRDSVIANGHCEGRSPEAISEIATPSARNDNEWSIELGGL